MAMQGDESSIRHQGFGNTENVFIFWSVHQVSLFLQTDSGKLIRYQIVLVFKIDGTNNMVIQKSTNIALIDI